MSPLSLKHDRVLGEIKHIRVNNEDGDKYSLGKSKECFDSIWDLVEAQLDRSLKSTKGDQSVQLIYPLAAPAEVIAPDLLKGAAEAGMDATAFDSNVMSFITGGVCVKTMIVMFDGDATFLVMLSGRRVLMLCCRCRQRSWCVAAWPPRMLPSR